MSARDQMLADILITAVEDGCSNSWRCVTNYEPDYCRVVVCEDEEGDGRFEKQHDVTQDTMLLGLDRIACGTVGANTKIVNAARVALDLNDACLFDAYSADAVLQAGLFGELVYG